ncbi:MAG: hypothetical protein JRF02_09755 [Deltaproteobacteria bacterium]|jgi:hypothetical protein|nr:hypothetical protein [Deltaproteobacteria bacterium]
MHKIQEIIEQITRLEKELALEIQKKEAEFYYHIKGKKVYFEETTRKYHKTILVSIHKYLWNASMLNILTVPVIWLCLVPGVFLDLAASVYQLICFQVYKIPKVKRRDYIIIDRHALEYLNAIEKLNCVYCGYFNGLIAYVQEIAARTEQYWCPIKHARKIRTLHSRYNMFFDYGDATTYRKNIEKVRRDFSKLS